MRFEADRSADRSATFQVAACRLGVAILKENWFSEKAAKAEEEERGRAAEEDERRRRRREAKRGEAADGERPRED